MSGAKKNPLLEVTSETRIEVRTLIANARYAALAVLTPESGHPACSRVGLATLENGTPVIFISALAAHTGALVADPRCSLLIGDPGKGDLLAHPRISIACTGSKLAPESDDAAAARQRYLSAHPKAKLYIDLPDFRFFRLDPIDASFNGGFGRAYALSAADVLQD